MSICSSTTVMVYLALTMLALACSPSLGADHDVIEECVYVAEGFLMDPLFGADQIQNSQCCSKLSSITLQGATRDREGLVKLHPKNALKAARRLCTTLQEPGMTDLELLYIEYEFDTVLKACGLEDISSKSTSSCGKSIL